jgi:hypothetical protein
MGTYGYAGLVNLGPLPITVGSKTAMHPVMLSEETNFDCVLGRSWMEKMGIKYVLLWSLISAREMSGR